MPCNKSNTSSTSSHQETQEASSSRPEEQSRKDPHTGMTLKDSGARETWETGANRDISAGKGRFDLLPMWALERVAKLYEAGCIKYGDRNWEKGIPIARYIDSALRHLCKFVRGDNDEDHLVAAAWNILCAMDTEARIGKGKLPESLLDLPRYDLRENVPVDGMFVPSSGSGPGKNRRYSCAWTERQEQEAALDAAKASARLQGPGGFRGPQ